MKKLLLILFFLPAVALGQVKVQYSPMSVLGWGQVPSATMASVQYGPVGIMHIAIDNPRLVDIEGNRAEPSTTGVYVVPLRLRTTYLNASAGAVYFDKKAPTPAGARMNVYLAAGVHYDIKSVAIGIQYIHISNSWTGSINPGYDFPTLTLEVEI